MTVCRHCHHPIDRDTSWFQVTIHSGRIVDVCSIACIAAILTGEVEA